MNVYMSLYLALLFVVLTPGILLTIPRKGPKLTVAVVHGLVFALVYYFTHNFVWQLTAGMEGFSAVIQVANNTAADRAAAAAALAAEKQRIAAANAAAAAKAAANNCADGLTSCGRFCCRSNQKCNTAAGVCVNK